MLIRELLICNKLSIYPHVLESSAVTLTAEDQKLIAAYRQGDEAAATELLEKYYVRLLELIRRQLGLEAAQFGRFGRRGTIGVPQLLFASA